MLQSLSLSVFRARFLVVTPPPALYNMDVLKRQDAGARLFDPEGLKALIPDVGKSLAVPGWGNSTKYPSFFLQCQDEVSANTPSSILLYLVDQSAIGVYHNRRDMYNTQ